MNKSQTLNVLRQIYFVCFYELFTLPRPRFAKASGFIACLNLMRKNISKLNTLGKNWFFLEKKL